MTNFKDKIEASAGKKVGESGAYTMVDLGLDLDLSFVDNNRWFNLPTVVFDETYLTQVLAIEKAFSSVLIKNGNPNYKYSLAVVTNTTTYQRLRFLEYNGSTRTECSQLIEYTGASRTGIESVTVGEYGGSGVSIDVVVDWDMINGINYLNMDDRIWYLNERAYSEINYLEPLSLYTPPVNTVVKKTQTVLHGLNDLSLVGWVTDGDEIVSSGSTGWSNYAYYNANLNEDKYSQTVVFKATNTGDFEIGIGKRANTSGTAITLKKEGTNSYLCVYRMFSASAPEENLALRLTIPDLENDKYYMLKLKKDVNEDRDYISQIVYPDNTVFDASQSGLYANYQWGYPTIYCITGECSVKDFTLSYPYAKKRNPKLIVFGDSLIEGNSIASQKEDRYISLLAQDLGVEEVAIFGKGGESTTSIVSRFYPQVDWFEDATYGLINLGGNDYASFATYQTNMLSMISYLKGKNITPIITTTCYRGDVDNSAFIAQSNPWVRGLGELYLDLSLAVSVEGDETTWKTDYLLGDGVHPTILGHAGIYAYIKYQLQFLFNE